MPSRLVVRAGGLLVLLAGLVTAARTEPAPSGPPYERTDVSVRGVVLGGVGLVALLIVTLVATTWIVVAWTGSWPDLAPPPTGVARGIHPVTLGPSGPRPVEAPSGRPRLQPAPGTDISILRAREQAALSRWAWVDREAGIAQVPIEVAMDLVAERGLPDWGGAAGGHRHSPAGGHLHGPALPGGAPGHAHGTGAAADAPATGATR